MYFHIRKVRKPKEADEWNESVFFVGVFKVNMLYLHDIYYIVNMMFLPSQVRNRRTKISTFEKGAASLDHLEVVFLGSEYPRGGV